MTTAAALGSVARSLAIDAHTAEVVAALQGADVPVVLLKGPSIARWLYTDGTPRSYGDSDLLVPDERFEAAQQVLEGLGLVKRPMTALDLDPRPHASTWARPDGSGVVDLHWTIPMVGAPDAVWSTIARDAESILVAGCDVPVESPPMRALHVALHAAQHGPHHGKPLEDLRRAVEQAPVETWLRAKALAEELHAVPALALGLALVPGGAELADRLSVDAGGATPELALRALGASATTHRIARVAGQPTWRLRVRAAVESAFPSGDYIRAWTERTGGGDGHVARAYGRRIWRATRDAPAALRAYLRVRRSGRQ